tara:strand:- start:536 stop:775 length:240 start_codon:yes stop_codon:yes gene_type:complete
MRFFPLLSKHYLNLASVRWTASQNNKDFLKQVSLSSSWTILIFSGFQVERKGNWHSITKHFCTLQTIDLVRRILIELLK